MQKRRPHWLVLGMAQALGVNLAVELRQGRLDREAYGDMLDRCANCGWAEACRLWTKGEGQGATRAPDICPNGAQLQALQRS